MKQIKHLSQLDMNGKYNYADYLNWKFEQRVELIRGQIILIDSTNRKHQSISWHLTFIISNALLNPEYRAFAAPFDVRLFDKSKSVKANQDVYSVVQPDICIICDVEKLDDKGCQGAPDLVIEILSAGNSKKEMKNKKQLYEENLIREYWIIDPEHETVHQFVLGDNQLYNPPIIYVSEDIVYADIFKELQVPLEKVFIY